MPTEDSRRVINDYLASIETGDNAKMLALFDPNMTWVVPGDLPPSGKHEGLGAVLDVMRQAFVNFVPGSFKVDVHSMLADGDNAAVEWTATAKLSKGGDYENHYAFFFEVRDGKIVLMREYADTQYARRVLFS